MCFLLASLFKRPPIDRGRLLTMRRHKMSKIPPDLKPLARDPPRRQIPPSPRPPSPPLHDAKGTQKQKNEVIMTMSFFSFQIVFFMTISVFFCYVVVLALFLRSCDLNSDVPKEENK